LLTFRNISNQAGAGNDIFNQTTAIMVDMGRALGEDAAGSAIRLGKALNDPITGLTALRKVGVGFTEEQEAQIKALQNSGDMMGAQKVILAELQAQFGGSGAAYAKTFSGQLELMGHELGTIGEEATMSVMPALQGVVEQLRELIPVIGPQLKAAIESVDFVALGQSVVEFTTFLVQNAEAITKTIAAIFIISTAYKTMAVAAGIAKAGLILSKKYHLVITNVPFLGSNRMSKLLNDYVEKNFSDAKYDLCTVFLKHFEFFRSISPDPGEQFCVLASVYLQRWSFFVFDLLPQRRRFPDLRIAIFYV
jgi:hypothetical protein